MPIKKVAHRPTMVKKGGNKMALKWVSSMFEEWRTIMSAINHETGIPADSRR
jgi:hypothetical protein